MITLAIDASTKSSGIAIFQQEKLIHYECITTNQSNSFDRINTMTQKLVQLCKKYSPTDIIMQDVLPQDVKHNQNIYKALIYLQASIVLQLYNQNKTNKVEFATSSHWRSLCGIKTGRGIKRQSLKAASQKLVKDKYNIDVNDDVSDAICLGMAYVKQHRSAF